MPAKQYYVCMRSDDIRLTHTRNMCVRYRRRINAKKYI